jgi:hypothetical protein
VEPTPVVARLRACAARVGAPPSRAESTTSPPLFLGQQQWSLWRISLPLWTRCDGPPTTSTDCSIHDGAATSPVLAKQLLSDKLGHRAAPWTGDDDVNHDSLPLDA